MKGGISTACFYPMETSESLALLLKDGHTHFELFFNTYREMRQPYLSRLRAMLEQYGGTIQSVHPFTSGYESMLLFSNYETRFEDSLQFYRAYCKAAKALGAKLVILHGMRCEYHSEEAQNRYFRRYQTLYRMGQSLGITIAQENVVHNFSQSPSFIRQMREALGDECAFCFDLKQAVRAGVDGDEMLDAMGDRLVHIHLNDNAPGETCLVPGEGRVDFPALLGHAKRNGFDGSVIIEVYRKNFQSPQALRESRERLENWIFAAEIGKNRKK